MFWQHPQSFPTEAALKRLLSPADSVGRLKQA
jgi:hypothetical protein